MKKTAASDHRQAEYKRPESVLVVVYTSVGDTLLMRRQRPAWPVFWQSVTGSLKWCEQTPLEAARRELEEETGIDADSNWRDWHHTFRFPVLPRYRHRYPPGCRHNVEHVFSLEIPAVTSVRVNPTEHSDSYWCPLNEATAKVWSWTNRAVLTALSNQTHTRS